MKFYQVTAHYTRPAVTVDGTSDGWRISAGVPTFYLRDDIQGITSAEDAARVARHMLKELAQDATFTVDIAVSADFDPAIIGA